MTYPTPVKSGENLSWIWGQLCSNERLGRCQRFPLWGRCAAWTTGRDSPAGLGFNVIGDVSGNLGRRVLAGNIIRLMRARGLPVAVLDVEAGGGGSEVKLPKGADEHGSATTMTELARRYGFPSTRGSRPMRTAWGFKCLRT